MLLALLQAVAVVAVAVVAAVVVVEVAGWTSADAAVVNGKAVNSALIGPAGQATDSWAREASMRGRIWFSDGHLSRKSLLNASSFSVMT